MAGLAALDIVVKLKDEASEGLDGISEKAGGLGTALGLAGAGALAFGGFLVGAASAAAEEEQGIIRLSGALQNNIPGWTGNSDAVEGYVTKTEGLAFADDKIRDSLASLVARTHDVTKAEELQAIAMDLARGKNIDLATATEIVGKVQGGNVGILARYGIAIDKGASSTEALGKIQETYAGQAQAYAQSTSGSVDRLKTAFGDAMETIGGAVLNIVEGPLKSIADWFTSPAVQAGIQAVADTLGVTLTNAINFVSGAIAAIQPIIEPFIGAWQNFFEELSNGDDVLSSIANLFTNFGASFEGAWATIEPVLGTLFQNIIAWIGTNGPGILAQLATWAQAFGAWIWNDAIPALLSALGGLISQLWAWLQANGPGILQQLGTWAQQFGAWIWDIAIPTLLQALGDLLGKIFAWIGENGPGILQTLGQWAIAFAQWVWNDAIPGLLSALGTLIAGLWQWIQDNGPGILTQLGIWTQQFFDWVMNDVVPQIPGWLANIATALWTWLSQTATDLGGKLVNEWIPALWQWITGPGGVVENIGIKAGEIATALWTWVTDTAKAIPGQLLAFVTSFWEWITGKGGVLEGLGAKLGEIVTGITTWVTDTVKELPAKIMAIGGAILQGILDGLGGAAKAIGDFLMGIAKGIWNDIVAFFTGSATVAAADPGNQNPENNPPPSNQRGRARGGTVTGNTPYMVGENGPEMFVPGRTGSIIPNGSLSGGGVSIGNVIIYAGLGTDGAQVASRFLDELEAELGTNIRIRHAGALA